MTRKTYIQLAQEFGRILGTANDEHKMTAWQVIHCVSALLKSDNERFDRSRFEQAIMKEMSLYE